MFDAVLGLLRSIREFLRGPKEEEFDPESWRGECPVCGWNLAFNPPANGWLMCHYCGWSRPWPPKAKAKKRWKPAGER